MRRMYSKKQVEEIAQSAVSSGTKLYRHYLTFETNEKNYIFTFFSPNNIPLTKTLYDDASHSFYLSQFVSYTILLEDNEGESILLDDFEWNQSVNSKIVKFGGWELDNNMNYITDTLSLENDIIAVTDTVTEL